MKRKDNLKKENLRMIDPAALEEILGPLPQVTGAADTRTTIAQASFSSFFHS
jgi:hypothetical protein